jgi:Domain of unknown function (DUF5655)
MTPGAYFDGSELGMAVFERVRSALDAMEELGPIEVRVTKTQVAFRRKRGFAYVWLPGQHLRNPDAEVVLSFALGRRDSSSRFKEVSHPSDKHWMHHLEVQDMGDVDDEVVQWLREAAERAG